MLASLLPGLRDLRAPLTAGYVLLLAIYLAFADELSLSSLPRSPCLHHSSALAAASASLSR